VNGKTKISLNHDVLLTSADADEYFDHTGLVFSPIRDRKANVWLRVVSL
jgi:hypothetical protein